MIIAIVITSASNNNLGSSVTSNRSFSNDRIFLFKMVIAKVLAGSSRDRLLKGFSDNWLNDMWSNTLTTTTNYSFDSSNTRGCKPSGR